MFRLPREREQGAALVEFALVTMILVPLVIYVIYSGEAVTAGIKAAEAEISAGWDITAYRTHDYEGGGSQEDLLKSAADKSAKKVDEALKDFNSFHDAGHAGYWGVFGHMTLNQLACKPRSVDAEFGPYAFGTSYLQRGGWVGCATEVQFENKTAVTNAHQEFYKGRPKIIQDSFAKLTMGGLGQPFKGCDDKCKRDDKRGFLVLTDDYGLENPNPTEVQDYGSGNEKYYNVGKSMWSGSGGGVGAAAIDIVAFATIGLTDQAKTGSFKMGYLKNVAETRSFGNDGGGMDLHLSPYHDGSNRATKNTANISRSAYEKREAGKYLGKPKDWNKP